MTRQLFNSKKNPSKRVTRANKIAAFFLNFDIYSMYNVF